MGRGTSTGGLTGTRMRGAEDVRTHVLAKVSRSPELPCEDAVLLDQNLGVALVADGMGSYKGGSEAAKAAVDAAHFLGSTLPPREDLIGRYRWLQDALPTMSAAVTGRMIEIGSDGGATAAMAVIADDPEAGLMAFVASVGDARAYRYSPSADELTRLTTDDSLSRQAGSDELFDEASDREALSESEYRIFKQRHKVTDALGKMDGRGPVQVEPAPMETGDLLILCSDGIHDNLTGTEIATICRASSADELAERLAAAARARSLDESHLRHKDDDISVVVVDPAA